MNTVSPTPEDKLEENLCPGCGSAIHLHVCAICQTVTSCRFCNEPLHAQQWRADYAVTKIEPHRVAFRIARNIEQLQRRVMVADATAQRSRAALENEPAPNPASRSAAALIEKDETPPQGTAVAVNDPSRVSNANTSGTRGEGRDPVFGTRYGGAFRDLAAPASKKLRAAMLLMLASGVAAAYYATESAVQTSPVSAMDGAGAVARTAAAVPAAGREARGEITRKPQLADGGERRQKSIEPSPPVATRAADSRPAVPAQGKQTEHLQPAATNTAPAIAAAPAPLPVAAERVSVGAEVAQRAIGSQAALASSGSSDMAKSRTGGEEGSRDRAAVRCSTASQALGLCDARTR
jgi:hypothetical protein